MNPGLTFEYTMRLFLGDKADHIAGQETNLKYRRRWIKKALNRIEREVRQIQTTPRHQRLMLSNLEKVRDELGRSDQPSWLLVDRLLALLGRLLGIDFLSGSHLHNISYWQTPEQHFTSDLFQGGDPVDDASFPESMNDIRRETIFWLKEKGLSDFRVGLVLGMSEYGVQKLRRDANAL